MEEYSVRLNPRYVQNSKQYDPVNAKEKMVSMCEMVFWYLYVELHRWYGHDKLSAYVLWNTLLISLTKVSFF